MYSYLSLDLESTRYVIIGVAAIVIIFCSGLVVLNVIEGGLITWREKMSAKRSIVVVTDKETGKTSIHPKYADGHRDSRKDAQREASLVTADGECSASVTEVIMDISPLNT